MRMVLKNFQKHFTKLISLLLNFISPGGFTFRTFLFNVILSLRTFSPFQLLKIICTFA
jgi:hypothetical protein